MKKHWQHSLDTFLIFYHVAVYSINKPKYKNENNKKKHPRYLCMPNNLIGKSMISSFNDKELVMIMIQVQVILYVKL